MGKVLLSFLGTGSKDAGRQYREMEYRFNDGTQYTTSFVAEAISSHYKIDKTILIGTVKSMWEEVYFKFSQRNGIQPDEDYVFSLADFCEKTTYASELTLPDIGRIEEAIGGGSKVVLIHYGLTQEEIRENEKIIMEVEQYLEKGDELYVDITHSFRSLPMIMMNLLIYMKNVSSKNIEIKHITYGMMDVSRELGYAPVVDIEDIMRINEWIMGAYAFEEFGKGYKIAELVGKDTPAGKRIIDFSNALSLNHLYSIKDTSRTLRSVAEMKMSDLAEYIVPQLSETYGRTLSFKGDEKASAFQLKVAKWHYDHMNYSSSYMALIESLISYGCERLQKDASVFEKREEVRALYNGYSILESSQQIIFADFDRIKAIFNKTNKIRNSIAHMTDNGSNLNKMINTLKEELTEAAKTMK